MAGFTMSVGLAMNPAEGAWAPTVRAGFIETASETFSTSNGTASFAVRSALAEVCPIAARFARRATLRPCLLGEFGTLVATGLDTTNARSVERPWAAVGLEARLDVRLLGPLWVNVGAGVVSPVVVDRFVIGGATVFELPRATGQSAVGLSIAVP
jgi:hypothetical protein